MDYNQFSYYRANPYAKQGYMPPTAFINRHKPNFLTQLPMGEEHLTKIGRKQYTNNSNKSHIETENLLKSPQRYPYQNRIALDKKYERNLNTIDIEGATGGTLMSQAVRNKLKAREELLRRQENSSISNSVQLDNIKNIQAFQQQKRRKIAYTQFVRDQQLKYASDNKIPKDRVINQEEISKEYSKQQPQAPKYPLHARNELDNISLIKRRYHSIDASKLAENPQSDRSYNQGHQSRTSTQMPRPSEEYNELMAKDRVSHRYQNPTNLSSEGSIHSAARRIIQGS